MGKGLDPVFGSDEPWVDVAALEVDDDTLEEVVDEVALEDEEEVDEAAVLEEVDDAVDDVVAELTRVTLDPTTQVTSLT